MKKKQKWAAGSAFLSKMEENCKFPNIFDSARASFEAGAKTNSGGRGVDRPGKGVPLPGKRIFGKKIKNYN